MCTVTGLMAQDLSEPEGRQYKNSLQAEVLGGGYLYSLNYERLLITRQKLTTAGQAGFSFWGSYGNFVSVLRFDGTELIGQKTAKFEVGFGVVFFNESSSSNSTSY